MRPTVLILVASLVLSSPAWSQSPPATPAFSDQDVSDAYIYLLARLLVARQQQIDFKSGFVWNQLVHREPGGVDWPNPNLDVAYSEAWVAVDEGSCTILTVPKVTGRYYTVQFLNGWGESIANINERVYPDRPSGQFALCLKGASVDVPAGARRVDLPIKYARVLARVELGKDSNEAVALQRQFALKATGSPKLPEIPKTPMFDLEKLPGVEAFEAAESALDSEADINPGMEPLQAKVRALAKAVTDPAERARVDRVIRERALADFAKAAPTIGHGTARNGWVRPSVVGQYGKDWLTRTLIDYGGIWANIPREVMYYKGAVDGTGAPLTGDDVYTITFPKDQLPAPRATHFWSVIAVDDAHFRVLPNPQKRYLINNQSKLEYGADGSLTLYFADQKPEGAPDGNWLPTPKGQRYRLTFRFYRPAGGVADGTYYPPPMQKKVAEPAPSGSETPGSSSPTAKEAPK
jgi:hypothetical protein